MMIIMKELPPCSNVTQPGYPGEEEGEELYESIYEVIRQPSSESDFEEINEEEVCLFVCIV